MAKKLIGSNSIKAYYEPLFQKPKSLGLDMPGFHYWGPTPDDGTGYGAYVCEHDAIGVVGKVCDSVFCPSCSRVMKHVGSFGTNKDGTVKASTMDKLNKAKMYNLPACTACKNSIKTSANWLGEGGDNTYCMHCGENLTDEVSKLRASITGGQEIKASSNELIQSVLASPSEFKDLNEEDINMTLYCTETDGFWNIDIMGQPVAQIAYSSLISDNKNKEKEISSLFNDEIVYPKAIKSSIIERGLVETLAVVKAKVWASQTDVADVYKKARAEAQASFEATNANYKEDLLENIALVCAGMDKNFYKDVNNELKIDLFNNMDRYNIPEATIIDIVESSFRTGAPQYFEAVLDKAEEYMSLTAKAKEELKKIIGGSNYLDPRSNVTASAQVTAGSLMEANSVDLSAIGGATKAYNYEAEKAEIKDLFKRF